MNKLLRIILVFVSSCIVHSAFSQVSILTDASALKNFNQQQRFWAFGQTVMGNYHASKKETIYAWVSYYTNGRFKNDFNASAKDPNTPVQQLPYRVYSSLRYRQLSVGWKHYFAGAYNNEQGLNIYGLAGFGLLLGKTENRYSASIDTTKYIIESPLPGSAKFNRLTFDAGLGVEFPLGADIYFYNELRTWIASSHYPSPYLLKNNYHIPSMLAANFGIRILIQ